VTKTLAGLQHVKMVYRPRRFNQPHGVKWTTKAGRVSVSAYDKFEKDHRSMDEGKLRLTVSIGGDPNKRQLKEYGMKTVGGLLDNDGRKWLGVIQDEVHKMGSGSGAGHLRLVVEEAVKALCVTVKKKKY